MRTRTMIGTAATGVIAGGALALGVGLGVSGLATSGAHAGGAAGAAPGAATVSAAPPWASISPVTSDTAVDSRLRQLAGTQTPTQIAAILASGQPTEGLLDPRTGTILAAYIVNPLAARQ